MSRFWTVPTINMMYVRQKYTNLMVGECGILIFKVVVIMLLFLFLSFDVLSPCQVHIPYFFGQIICPNILKCQLDSRLHFEALNLSSVKGTCNLECH